MMRDLYIASCACDGGIYHYKTDGRNLSFCEKTKLDRPMYMIRSGNKMYVILREPFNDEFSGMVSFDIDRNGKLTNQSDIISTKGVVACHLCADGDNIYAVNYVSGSVIKFPDRLVCHEGKGVNPLRQSAPHTHFAAVTPDNKYICVTDLGLDTVFFYDKDLNVKFSVKVPEGYGARHLAFSSGYMYCVNELVSSVTVFKYDGENTRLIKTYPAVPADFTGDNLAAAIRIKDNKLYISNRGHNSIAVFEICGESLELKGYIPVGKEPRDFNIFDEALISADMADNRVTFYKLNGFNTEKLDTVIENIKEPLCVLV